MALVGIGAIAVEKLEGAAIWPLLMTVVAAASWAVANIVVKKTGKIDMFGFVVWSSLVPPIPLFVLSLLFEGPGAVPFALAYLKALEFSGATVSNGARAFALELSKTAQAAQ